ncbi:MAG TPA: CBS domain-containing protein [Nitrososphaeraceae archaeon]|jgi:signal-transduction protein with cAMP-binding, CBS, and nucleotidyltransferase domain
MKVEDIMRKKLETIEELSSIQQAAQKMKDKNVSSLVVVDSNGEPQGLVTERDLVRKVCINDVRTNTITNKEIMSSHIITIKHDSSPSEAADMMLQYNIRHLLVVHDTEGNQNNNPIGILTPLDFTRYQEYSNDNEKDSIEKILEYYR